MSLEEKVDEGNRLLRLRSYDEAITLYGEILEAEANNYDVWYNLIKAYVRQDKFDEADSNLESYFDKLSSDTSLSEDERDQRIMGITSFVADIRSERGDVGSWYDVLEPGQVSFDQIAEMFEPGESIELVIPKGFVAHYTLDGTRPTVESKIYEGPIELLESGTYTITVMLVNDYGIEGVPTSITIMSDDAPPALMASLEAGVYEDQQFVFFEGYDYDTMDLLYTLDGSDPMNGLYYDSYSGIKLIEGAYTLRAIYYDYNTGEHSRETTVEYEIISPYSVSEETTLTVAIFGSADFESDEVGYTLSAIMYDYSHMFIDYYIVDSLDQLIADLETGVVDMVYTSSSFVEDMALNDLILPIADLFEVDPADYYNNALSAGYYNGAYYTLPVAISPSLLLYYQNDDVESYYTDIDSWDQLIEIANDGESSYNFIYPEDVIGEWLFGYYLGYGGTIEYDEVGNYILDKAALVEAMSFAYNMPLVYGLGYEGMDMATYYDAMENGTATMILGLGADLSAYDTNYLFSAAGAMPLPNGGFAGAVNQVSGLHLTQNAILDENKFKVAQVINDYLSNQYYANYIAGYAEGIPAKVEALNEDYLWVDGDIADFEHAVVNNITIPYTYQLIGAFDTMTNEMSAVLYGGLSIEDGAQNIIDALAQGVTYEIN